jgi:CrcB protein
VALVSALAIGLGGAAGALSRHALTLGIDRPLGDTFLVNTAGSFLIGLVLGIDVEGPAALALAVGFCGAFTTFSSFAVATVRLLEDGRLAAAIANVAVTLAAALGAVLVGTAVAGAA